MKEVDKIVDKYDLLVESLSRTVERAQSVLDSREQDVATASSSTQQPDPHQQPQLHQQTEPGDLEPPVRFSNIKFDDISYDDVMGNI